MLETLSHEKLDKIVTLLTDVAVAIVKAKEDGGLDVEDVKFLLPVFSSLMPAIAALSGVGEEIKHLTVEDWMGIIATVLGKLGGVVSDKLAAVIKQSLVCVIEAAKLYSILKS